MINFLKKIDKKVVFVLAGILTGFINGVFGGGGGMIIVPILSMIIGYGEKQAQFIPRYFILFLQL